MGKNYTLNFTIAARVDGQDNFDKFREEAEKTAREFDEVNKKINNLDTKNLIDSLNRLNALFNDTHFTANTLTTSLAGFAKETDTIAKALSDDTKAVEDQEKALKKYAEFISSVENKLSKVKGFGKDQQKAYAAKIDEIFSKDGLKAAEEYESKVLNIFNQLSQAREQYNEAMSKRPRGAGGKTATDKLVEAEEAGLEKLKLVQEDITKAKTNADENLNKKSLKIMGLKDDTKNLQDQSKEIKEIIENILKSYEVYVNQKKQYDKLIINNEDSLGSKSSILSSSSNIKNAINEINNGLSKLKSLPVADNILKKIKDSFKDESFKDGFNFETFFKNAEQNYTKAKEDFIRFVSGDSGTLVRKLEDEFNKIINYTPPIEKATTAVDTGVKQTAEQVSELQKKIEELKGTLAEITGTSDKAFNSASINKNEAQTEALIEKVKKLISTYVELEAITDDIDNNIKKTFTEQTKQENIQYKAQNGDIKNFNPKEYAKSLQQDKSSFVDVGIVPTEENVRAFLNSINYLVKQINQKIEVEITPIITNPDAFVTKASEQLTGKAIDVDLTSNVNKGKILAGYKYTAEAAEEIREIFRIREQAIENAFENEVTQIDLLKMRWIELNTKAGSIADDINEKLKNSADGVKITINPVLSSTFKDDLQTQIDANNVEAKVYIVPTIDPSKTNLSTYKDYFSALGKNSKSVIKELSEVFEIEKFFNDKKQPELGNVYNKARDLFGVNEAQKAFKEFQNVNSKQFFERLRSELLESTDTFNIDELNSKIKTKLLQPFTDLAKDSKLSETAAAQYKLLINNALKSLDFTDAIQKGVVDKANMLVSKGATSSALKDFISNITSQIKKSDTKVEIPIKLTEKIETKEGTNTPIDIESSIAKIQDTFNQKKIPVDITVTPRSVNVEETDALTNIQNIQTIIDNIKKAIETPIPVKVTVDDAINKINSIQDSLNKLAEYLQTDYAIGFTLTTAGMSLLENLTKQTTELREKFTTPIEITFKNDSITTSETKVKDLQAKINEIKQNINDIQLNINIDSTIDKLHTVETHLKNIKTEANNGFSLKLLLGDVNKELKLVFDKINELKTKSTLPLSMTMDKRSVNLTGGVTKQITNIDQGRDIPINVVLSNNAKAQITQLNSALTTLRSTAKTVNRLSITVVTTKGSLPAINQLITKFKNLKAEYNNIKDLKIKVSVSAGILGKGGQLSSLVTALNKLKTASNEVKNLKINIALTKDIKNKVDALTRSLKSMQSKLGSVNKISLSFKVNDKQFDKLKFINDRIAELNKTKIKDVNFSLKVSKSSQKVLNDLKTVLERFKKSTLTLNINQAKDKNAKELTKIRTDYTKLLDTYYGYEKKALTAPLDASAQVKMLDAYKDIESEEARIAELAKTNVEYQNELLGMLERRKIYETELRTAAYNKNIKDYKNTVLEQARAELENTDKDLIQLKREASEQARQNLDNSFKNLIDYLSKDLTDETRTLVANLQKEYAELFNRIKSEVDATIKAEMESSAKETKAIEAKDAKKSLEEQIVKTNQSIRDFKSQVKEAIKSGTVDGTLIDSQTRLKEEIQQTNDLLKNFDESTANKTLTKDINFFKNNQQLSQNLYDEIYNSITKVSGKDLSLTGRNELDRIKGIVDSINKKPLDIITAEELDDLNKALDVLQKISSANSKRGTEYIKGDLNILDREYRRFTEQSNANPKFDAMNPGKLASLEVRFNALKNSVDPSKESVDAFVRSLTELRIQANETGQVGNTFFDSWKKRMGSLAVYLTSFASFYRIFGYIRQSFETIHGLDTALVDLKKTAKMTNGEFEEFYINSNKIAKQFGVTTKDIIDQAASWSRLGYNTKETASTMAQVSSQFASISPGMEVDKATTGLVSIMKAFDIEAENAKEGIASKINAIGNAFATSNEEIVTGLEKSSAAMAAANNSLDQTIALFTAGQEILQNAETMGQSLKTISMRIRGRQNLDKSSNIIAPIRCELYALFLINIDDNYISQRVGIPKTQERFVI